MLALPTKMPVQWMGAGTGSADSRLEPEPEQSVGPCCTPLSLAGLERGQQGELGAQDAVWRWLCKDVPSNFPPKGSSYFQSHQDLLHHLSFVTRRGSAQAVCS